MPEKLPDQKIIEICDDAIRYLLSRIKRDPQLLGRFFMTEAHAKLVTAQAAIHNTPRSVVAEQCEAHHDDREDYGVPN